MKVPVPNRQDRALIEDLVQQATSREKVLENLLEGLFNQFAADSELMKDVHSMKWRVKGRDHLRDKLLRKWEEARTKVRTLASLKKIFL